MRLSRRIAWLGLAFLALWLAFALWTTRYAMLDDALIHLRYASFLRTTHRITYDGVHPAYGTSSLLYVWLLALLSNVFAGPMLPKCVSIVCYIGFLSLLVWLLHQVRRSLVPRLILAGLLISCAAPMGVRWLADGMETSLALIPVALLGWIVSREARADAERPVARRWIGLAAIGALLTFLRVEMTSLAFLAGATLFCSMQARQHGSAARGVAKPALWKGLALPVGSASAAATIALIMGHLLPDTALAKQGAPGVGASLQFPIVLASSALLGLGVLSIAFVAAVLHALALHRRSANAWDWLAWVCGNAMFPLLVVLAGVRGQEVQGVRYILWALVFAAVWNAFQLEGMQDEAGRAATLLASRQVGVLAVAWLVMAIALLPVDFRWAMHAMHGRAKTFLAMRDGDLQRFRGMEMASADVGFIGYFSQAHICDLEGLVNGRAVAAKPQRDRFVYCAAQHPRAAFLIHDQLAGLESYMDMRLWVVCMRVNFQNARSTDVHYLLVDPTLANTLCPNASPLLQNQVPRNAPNPADVRDVAALR